MLTYWVDRLIFETLYIKFSVQNWQPVPTSICPLLFFSSFFCTQDCQHHPERFSFHDRVFCS